MNKKVLNATQAGFTLIELIVVIVILGILAATALPKVTSMGSEARVGVMNGVAGAITSAASIAYAKSAATGTAAYPAVTAIGALVDIPADVTDDAAGGFTHSGGATPANCKVTYSATTGKATVTDSTGC